MSKPEKIYNKWRIRWADGYGIRRCRTYSTYKLARAALKQEKDKAVQIRRGKGVEIKCPHCRATFKSLDVIGKIPDSAYETNSRTGQDMKQFVSALEYKKLSNPDHTWLYAHNHATVCLWTLLKQSVAGQKENLEDLGNR